MVRITWFKSMNNGHMLGNKQKSSLVTVCCLQAKRRNTGRKLGQKEQKEHQGIA